MREVINTRQVVDWSAAIWAGIIGGAVFFLASVLLLPLAVGGNAWVVARYFASILLGAEVLAPPATFELSIFAAALVAHFGLAIVFALLISFVIHKGGLLAGVIRGALLGGAIYIINVYTLTLLFPWLFALHGVLFFAAHVLYGAVVGWVYEGLEVEEFVAAGAEGGG
ncbi:MAG: hypothetical protein HKN20_00945 [Gemmatimonadetes bacterium]|nr:hypothetical protein [Gemmatimonadota bacterium]